MNPPKVSIIVPFYNVEKYIGKCLDSIKNQSFTDFEALLINDGSPDSSIEIAEKFAAEDKRFRVYTKPNGGLSDARNYGLARAEGEFVVLIDSDDYLHRDYLKVMVNECDSNNADVAYCRFSYSFFMGKLTIPMPFNARRGVLDTETAVNKLVSDTSLRSYAWNKIYRRTLFTDNDITYPKMYFEDIATSPRVMYHANRVAISNKFLYYYVKRFGSIMATMNAKKIDDLMLSILISRNYFEKLGVYDRYRNSVRTVASKMRLVNIYSIFRQHILKLDFRKLGYNLKTNNLIYRYVISDDYKPVDGIPEIPYRIHQPGRNKKKK